MSVASSAAAPVARPCVRSVLERRGPGYPADLALLWPLKFTDDGVLKSAKGPAPTFTDTPTLSAGGVIPGDGPSFTDVVTWEDGGTLVVEFTSTTASADLVGDVQVFGPLYAYSGGLKAMDGTNTASVATSWEASTELVKVVVTAVVQCDGDVMRVYIDGQNGNILASPNDITAASWSTSGSATRTNANTLTMAAASNSRLVSAASGYIPVLVGQVVRFTYKLADLTTANRRIQAAVTELVTPYAETSISNYAYSDGLICVEHVVTKNCNVMLYTGNLSSSPGSVKISDIRCTVKSGDVNSLVSFGDSICASAVETGGLLDNIAAYTAKYSALKNIGYRNRGVSGERLDQIAARFSAQVGTPGTVFIEGGVNDIFQASTDPNTSMRASITSMVGAAKALGANIVCFDVPKITISAEKETWRASYNTWLEAYCAAEGVQLVSLEGILTDQSGNQISSYYSADTTHPNALGHAAIADYLLRNINYVGDHLDGGESVLFDGTMPALALSDTAPGDLKSVQAWKKVASAKEIERY